MKRFHISISPGFLLLLAILIYLDGAGFAIQCMIACVLHEAGHYAAARIFGRHVIFLRVTLIGAEMSLSSHGASSYLVDLLIALSGPVVNMLTAWITAKYGLHLFAGINLCFGLMNLIPVRPLDGGRILTSLLSIFWTFAADKVMRLLSILFSGALLGLGWTAWRAWGNLSLLLVSAWITIGCINEKN